MHILFPKAARFVRHPEWMLRLALALVVVAYFVTTLPGVRDHAGFSFRLDGLLSNTGYGLAVLLAFWQAVRATRHRKAGLALAAGLAAYLAGSLYWMLQIRLLDPLPYPSPADAGWLAFFPLAYLSLGLQMRSRVKRVPAALWLDGLVSGLGAAALVAFVAVGPLLAATGGTLREVAVNLAYPVGDLLLLIFAVGVLAVLGWRVGRAGWLLLAGFLTFGAADVGYLLGVSNGSYVTGGWIDALWLAGFAAIAAACGHSLAAPERRGSGSRETVSNSAALVVPVLWVVASVAVLVIHTAQGLGFGVSTALAAATILVATARMVLAFVEVRALSGARLEARTDDLTRLTNRRGLYERLSSVLPSAQTGGGRAALLLLDLDRFKEINDSLGHHVGDKLLRQIGPRLSGILRDQDLLCRLGGDEFAIVLPETGVDEAVAVATRLRSALEDPFFLADIPVHIDASLGVALSPDHADEANGLLQCADIAMYQAKAAREGVRVYQPDRAGHGRERLETIEQLRVALATDQLVLHYQPKVEIASGAVTGVEALVRWSHPEQGLRYPDAFLPLVEQAGLMRQLTDRVLELALDQMVAWRVEGVPIPRVAVNLSASSVVDTGLPQRVGELLADRQLPPSVLELEITEEFLMADRVRAREVLFELRGTGICISIDDFGTGYSSLSYLRELPVDELKLDRSLVFPLADDARAAALVESTVGLAHSLGLRMVAEGVENEVTLNELRRYGCDEAQGYHLSRPLPAIELEEWVRARIDGRPSWSHLGSVSA